MGSQSIVSGHIVCHGDNVAHSAEIISTYKFDDEYPFTNIFWCDSPQQYFLPVIGFVGSYNQIEYNWNEWMWKFSTFLSHLDAFSACVNLDGLIGHSHWELMSKPFYDAITKAAILNPLESMIGSEWGIVEAPMDDFSLRHNDWGEKWNKPVPRWTTP